MELQVGVKVLLKNSEGKYLLLRRSADVYKEMEQKWDIPGGRIDPRAPLLENLAREVKEETGLELPDEPKLLAVQDIFPEGFDWHVVRLTYEGAADGNVRLSGEHTEHDWFTFDEMRKLGDLDRYLKELLDNGTIS